MTELPRAADLSKLDRYSRRQPGFWFHTMFPTKKDKTCACGCGAKLTGRRTRWANDQCSLNAYQHYAVRTGQSDTIRELLYKRDREVCAGCEVQCGRAGRPWPDNWNSFKDGFPWPTWEADHIVPVWEGGGGCGLDGYQTLCSNCHKEKTASDAARRAEQRRHKERTT